MIELDKKIESERQVSILRAIRAYFPRRIFARSDEIRYKGLTCMW